MACDHTVCTVCGREADLTTGALIQLPGTYRWVHRACLDRDGALSLSTTRRLAHVARRRPLALPETR